WSDVFRERFAGQPLKRIEVSVGERKERGEAIVTAAGLEGGVIYALSAPVREGLTADGGETLSIDLRPDMTVAALQQRLAAPRAKQSLATFLRKAVHLSPVEVGLLHEAAMAMPGKLAALAPDSLAALIKAVPVRVTGLAPIARAISTAGGIAFDAVDDSFMLRGKPGVFVAGEMLDWEAPTGGYLLQASFATGSAAARGTLAWLADSAKRG
ncbi:MAG: NAD(P)/FAD-dependent oxidoreductase, partial [Hyphomicrobiaceae bacterium]